MLIINSLNVKVESGLINNVTFIIDTNNKIIENKNYVLRLNKYDENENILFLPNNNNINIKKINWKEKKDRVYINKKYISEDNYNKLKDILNKEDFDFNENTNLEEINEYKYILYEENLETKNYELDILRLGTIIIKINENKIKTFYSDYIKLENNYIKYNINNNKEFEKLKEYKNNIKENTVLKIIENINNDLNILFNDEVYDNYLKNIFSRLSLKCESEQIINKRIFTTNRECGYIYNRLEYVDNKIEFNFQGKDFELMMKDKENKLNILINEFVTNIYYNNNNIFNFRIPGLISENISSKYIFIIRNKLLFLYKNKTTLVMKCTLPNIFNIELLGIRTFNKDSWWIC